MDRYLFPSRSKTIRLSIIIPARNEAGNITATLLPLQGMRRRGGEVIVVDGRSRDDTIEYAAPLADRVLVSAPGRARQMNAGARAATGRALWFLHADTLAPENADRLLLDALAERPWGRFDVRLSGRHFLLSLVAGAMNLRSRLTGIATGDQGIFLRRDTFQALGGFPELPLMEDIEISRRLKAIAGRPACLAPPLVTSSRRWEENGIARTILLMWGLRLAFALGVDPARLARWYTGRAAGSESQENDE
uniref:Transferase 2, rSAM/selenodomain-associated n=1 Tax=Candidatus Kentrum sp. FM TaxID=2126340 RepID=A0A450S0P5_9GAMM|nr:MAG: transferase 2, rSAM/selenodomain-associated [Candidatus Kentron sp. FM]VFJ46559.1 MAG: transferase 2, rSAM/selenodomain-associated [Candidatus Kentron sp. FM]